MRKIVLITALLFITLSSSAQDKLLDWEKTFTKLSENFVAKNNEIKKIDKDIAALLKQINLQTNEAVREELQRKEEIKKSQVKLYEEFLAYKKICLSKKEEEKKDILKWFPHKMPIMASSNNSGADDYCLKKVKELNTAYLVEVNKYDEAEKALLALPKGADATELQAKKEGARKAKEHIYNEFIALKESCIKLSGIEEATINSAFPHKKEDHQLDSDCENKIEALSKAYAKTKTDIAALEEAIATLREKEEEKKDEQAKKEADIEAKETEREELLEQLKTTYEEFNKHKEACVLLGKLTEVAANELFSHESPIREETETVVYTYFGKDNVIKEEIFDKNTVEGKVLTDLLSNTNSESYFGDITIPKEDEEFYFFKGNYKTKDKNKELKEIGPYKFKKIDIEIKDGMFADIRVTVEYLGHLHTFENKVGISFLRYAILANDNKLFYRQTINASKDFDLKKIEKLAIRLGDILTYNYTIGNNYVPHDLALTLPAKDANGVYTNKTGPAKYAIKQSTSLDKIVELRMYTDALAIVNEGDNGIVNFEGNAKFYVLQAYDAFLKGQLLYLPTIKPEINYSRFENGDGFVSQIDAEAGEDLQLVEKRFLSLTAEVDVFKYVNKTLPMSVALYSNWGYNLARLKKADDTFENIKSSNIGGGVRLDFKRFNNFNFMIKGELAEFNYKDFNGELSLPTKVPITKYQAELSYHPSNNSNQAAFLRLSSYNYRGSGEGEHDAFYQIQFGYKFSIGSRVVKKQQ